MQPTASHEFGQLLLTVCRQGYFFQIARGTEATTRFLTTAPQEITLNAKDFSLMWKAPLERAGFLVGDDMKVTLSIPGIAQ